MCRSKGVLCIVGALVAVLFAIAAPGYACPACEVEALEVYQPREAVILRQRVDYAPVVERQIVRQRVVVPVQKQVVVERVQVQRVHAPRVERVVQVERVRGRVFPLRERSKSVQIERIRY